MNFDLTTIVVAAVLTLILIGMMLAALMKEGASEKTSWWWIGAFLLTALGFVGFGAQSTPYSLMRMGMNCAFLAGYACFYNGARKLMGRKSLIAPVVIGAVIWPVFITVFEPSLSVRSTAFSVLVCVYTLGAAAEFVQGTAARLRNCNVAAIVCLLHAVFYVVRAIRGPALGLADVSDASSVSTWSAIVSLEALPFCAIMAILVISISLERIAQREKDLAFTDYLTNVGNRRSFEAEMKALKGCARRGEVNTLLLFDLDDFKSVNDRHGHLMGDQLLCAFAKVISSNLPEQHLFWRLGGDEFAAVVRGKTAEEIEALIWKFRRGMQIPSSLQGVSSHVSVGFSIGTALITGEQNLTQTMRAVDEDLYRNKQSKLVFAA